MDGTILNKKYNLVERVKALEEGGGGGEDSLKVYQEIYTGTGAASHVLDLDREPVLITHLGRADNKVVLTPFSPQSLSTRVDWLIPNVGNGTVSISEDNGIKITGVDAGQACNTEGIDYVVEYLA